MKIECVRDKLVPILQSVERIASKNLSLPILSCIYLEAKDSELILRTTNLDVGVEIRVPAKVEVPGVVAIGASILTSFVASVTLDKNIKFELIEGNLKVTTAHNSTILKAQPADDFPALPSISSDDMFLINSQDFLKGLKSVSYSASVSGVKPELSSVCVYCEDGNVVFVATDSFRLAEKKIKARKSKDFGQILIPVKNVVDIIRVFDGIDADLEIGLSKNQLTITYESIYFVSRVIDGIFPDYKQILPKQSTTEVVVLKNDLIDALKLSNLFSDKFHQVKISVSPSSKSFELKAKSNDIGENVRKIDATLEGDDVEVNFNQKYITDCFQSIDADSMSLSLSGLNRPMIIHPVGGGQFTYLVMPMNR
ncbi:MAG: DNA polymerase III subunit beta [Candidatus Taylorbacteria bacterium]|nr:DNA polymerase III subunit beta [Candidatus Taylorbacteria bacterium]